MNLQFKYKRDKHGQPRGVIVVDRDNLQSYGWSLCRKGDRFCKKMGREIATARLIKGSKVEIPHSLARELGETLNYLQTTKAVQEVFGKEN